MRVVYASDHRLHAPQREFEASSFQPPFEHPGRAEAILGALAADERFNIVEPAAWGDGPIAAVHDRGLIDFLATAWDRYQVAHPDTADVVPDLFSLAACRDGMGPAPDVESIDVELGRWCFETTTPITSGTYRAARASADVAVSAAAMIADGERAVYGLCRPPGHHAPRAAYGGYCFFNNAAVAAEYLSGHIGDKVTVLDVDYHHGNGTQQIFYQRPDVQFASLHGDPRRAYPHFAGFADEVGAGRGRGTNVNVPLPAGTSDDAYLARLEHTLERVQAFGPAAVVVSLGVDTYYDDPHSDLGVTPEGLARSGATVAALGVPTVVLQEGGYATDQLGENVSRWLGGMLR